MRLIVVNTIVAITATASLVDGFIQKSPHELHPNVQEGLGGVVSDCASADNTDCITCVSTPQSTYFGKITIATPCRWCPEAQSCHAYGSLAQTCAIPVHTNNIDDTDYAKYACRAAEYPHNLADFSNTDVDALAQWVVNYMNHFSGTRATFPTYTDLVKENGVGYTGIYNMNTGGHLLGELCFAENNSNTNTTDSPYMSHFHPHLEKGATATKDYIPEIVKIALVSDWGSGTLEAQTVSNLVQQYAPDYTFHLGDVYYEALPEEIDANVLGKSPNAYQRGVTFHDEMTKKSFWLNGNHEMLSLGHGYFNHLLPIKSQLTSYMVLENEHWRVIGLDTGYGSYNQFKAIEGINELSETDAALNSEQYDWLNGTLELTESCKTDKRGIVILTHHQPMTDFTANGAYTGPPKQIAELIGNECTIIWIAGHEHQFSTYEKTDSFDDVELSVYHRLIGNGGFPQKPQTPSKKTNLQAWDNRAYREFELNGGKTESYLFGGYMTMEFGDEGELDIEYLTFDSVGEDGSETPVSQTVIASESFVVGEAGVELKTQFLNKDILTIVDDATVILHDMQQRVRQRWALDDGVQETEDLIGETTSHYRSGGLRAGGETA